MGNNVNIFAQYPTNELIVVSAPVVVSAHPSTYALERLKLRTRYPGSEWSSIFNETKRTDGAYTHYDIERLKWRLSHPGSEWSSIFNETKRTDGAYTHSDIERLKWRLSHPGSEWSSIFNET